MLVRNQTKLRGIYEFECISEELLMRLSIKESFYQVCEEHGFSFPKTTTCTYENHKNLELPFDFPVIISVAYWNCKFPHKKKVFVANTREEFDAILDAIYGSSYKDHLILQEFIPGDDSKMRVMNCYCGKDKKVKLIALGNAVLEEHSPEGIGSYAAIINGYDEKLNETMKNFLEGIGYVGFANFDMKYDERDGKYKLFEMNLRQGRSSPLSQAQQIITLVTAMARIYQKLPIGQVLDFQKYLLAAFNSAQQPLLRDLDGGAALTDEVRKQITDFANTTLERYRRAGGR